MLTPQGKGWTGWSTPAPANQRSGGGPLAASAPLGKGKGTSQRTVELEQQAQRSALLCGVVLYTCTSAHAQANPCCISSLGSPLSLSLSLRTDATPRRRIIHRAQVMFGAVRSSSTCTSGGVWHWCVALRFGVRLLVLATPASTVAAETGPSNLAAAVRRQLRQQSYMRAGTKQSMARHQYPSWSLPGVQPNSLVQTPVFRCTAERD